MCPQNLINRLQVFIEFQLLIHVFHCWFSFHDSISIELQCVLLERCTNFQLSCHPNFSEQQLVAIDPQAATMQQGAAGDGAPGRWSKLDQISAAWSLNHFNCLNHLEPVMTCLKSVQPTSFVQGWWVNMMKLICCTDFLPILLPKLASICSHRFSLQLSFPIFLCVLP